MPAVHGAISLLADYKNAVVEESGIVRFTEQRKSVSGLSQGS